MDLAKVISEAKTDFSATIFQSHFKRSGGELGTIKVHAELIVFATKLDGNAVPTETQYLAFGENGKYFAAYLIEGKPKFDNVVRMNQPLKTASV